MELLVIIFVIIWGIVWLAGSVWEKANEDEKLDEFYKKLESKHR